MQKKIIALAVAGLVSGAAFAQTNVTVYGTADATFDNVKASGATTTTATSNAESRNRVTMNSSFIGFKGSEDLGGGLKALFQFETGVGENTSSGTALASGNLTTSAAALGWTNRDTFVGLSGGFGTLVAGNLTGPTRGFGAAMDVNSGSTGIGANSAMLGKLGGGSGASLFDQRISNAVAYTSPTFSGFGATVGYMANENKNNGSAPLENVSAWDLGLAYANGPIMVRLTNERVKDKGTTAPGKATDTRFGGKFTDAGWSVGLLWDRVKVEGLGLNVKRTAWFLPVTFNVSAAGKIIGQYVSAGDVTNVANSGAKMFVLGYEHSLSKRTVVKALWSQISNEANASYDYMYGVTDGRSNTTGIGVSGFGNGADPKGFSVGLRHTF
ncbi:MAG: porin [Gammaproteobacteria bacterium]|nr:porin [Rhodocyclaceae bacterium]MBU3909391.1 porin [Gammaproteobacteria bacterium]MBU3990212.1 porin [Gammaproteobacteria bacterium]MBU4005449.1 porin [Gammaproteobacteria bacterium]MBU4020998.1 porin [Gammaproteobacteria bacterium]